MPGVSSPSRRPNPKTDYEEIVEAIAGLVSLVESELGSTATVGIGHPGTISPATGLIKNSNSHGAPRPTLDHDLAHTWTGRFGSPTMPTASPLSEAADGAGMGASHRLWCDPRHRRRRGWSLRRQSHQDPTRSGASGDTTPFRRLRPGRSSCSTATAAGRVASRDTCPVRAFQPITWL